MIASWQLWRLAMVARVVTARLDPLQERTSSAGALVVIAHVPGPSSGTSAIGSVPPSVPPSVPLETPLLGASAIDLTVELVVVA